jgi:hypothetical protein
VGELAVQLRTTKGADDRPFAELLQRHKQKAERKKAGVCLPPPEGYVCHRCGVVGHWVTQCPSAEGRCCGDEVNSSTRGRGRGRGRTRGGSDGGRGEGISASASRTGARSVVEHEQGSRPADGATGEGDLEDAATARSMKRAKHAKVGDDGKSASYGPPPPGYVCKACHCPGHWLEQCERRDEYKRGAPPAGYVCHKCNQVGHWVHNCTVVPAHRRREARSDGGGTGGADSAHSDTLAEPTEESIELGEEIGEALEEETADVLALLARCVEVLGEATCRQLLVQTWQVESTGGLLTLDGSSRRRTAGGVFFWLVKQKASTAQRALVFESGR